MGIIEEYFSPKFIGPLIDKLKSIRGERKKEINEVGNVFGDPEELAKYYIEPNCQHANPANEEEDDPASVVSSPIFKTINKFLNGDFAVRGDGRNILFVLADAGMGKTSLLMMLKLSHITSFWPSRYDCRLLKLGKNSIEVISKIPNKSNTILLLDALDEDPESFGKVKERLINLIDETHNFRRVILTCRTQFFPNDEIDPFKRIGKIRIESYVCPMLFLSLFDEDQVDEYLTKRLSDEKDRRKAKQIIIDMGSLRFRPLLLAHIDGFIDSNNKEWNEYSVFDTLVETWLRREQVKLKAQKRNVNSTQLLNAATSIALLMHKDNSRTISEEILEEYIRKGDSELKRIKQIDIGGRSLLNKNSDDEYRFSHYSIHEFLLAKAIIDKKVTECASVRFTDRIFDFTQIIEKKIFLQIDYNNANLSGRDLRGMDFSGLFLEKSNFSNSNLQKCRFESCSMEGIKFMNANMSETRLSGSDVRNSDFSGVNLSKSTMRGCLLENARCIKVNLNGSDLSGCDLSHADLSNASAIEAKFEKSNMSYARIRKADLTSANTQGAKIEGIVAAGAELRGTSISTPIKKQREIADSINLIQV